MVTKPLYTPGIRLRTAREHAGLTQADLAKQLGCTKAYVSRVERDTAPIGRLAGPAAGLLGVTTDFLLLGIGKPFEIPDRQVFPAISARNYPEMEILRLLINQEPADEQRSLITYLVRQVQVYRETLRDLRS